MIRIGHKLFKPKEILRVTIWNTARTSYATALVTGQQLEEGYSLVIATNEPDPEKSTPTNIVYSTVIHHQSYPSKLKRNLWLLKLLKRLVQMRITGKLKAMPVVSRIQVNKELKFSYNRYC